MRGGFYFENTSDKAVGLEGVIEHNCRTNDLRLMPQLLPCLHLMRVAPQFGRFFNGGRCEPAPRGPWSQILDGLMDKLYSSTFPLVHDRSPC